MYNESNNTASTPIPRRGYFYVVLAALLWAVSGSSAKFLFNQGVTTLQLVQMRVTLASCLLFVWLLFRYPAFLKISSRDILYFIVLGVAGMAAVQFAYLYTISKIQVAAAILLEYLSPILIALYMAIVERERPSQRTLLAIAGATAGCYLVVGAYNLNLLSMNLHGIVSGLLSAVTFAFYSVYGERGMRRYHPWTVLFFAILFSAVFWNLARPPFEFIRRSYSLTEWSWIFYIVVFGTVVPFGLYLEGINLIRSTRASVTATLEPIAASGISYLFLGEVLEPLQLLGGVLVIASIVTLQLKREYDNKTPELIRARDKASDAP